MTVLLENTNAKSPKWKTLNTQNENSPNLPNANKTQLKVHSFWKKEYQWRVAPHYHILLWIKDVPVIGVDPEHVVTERINKRISSHILDEKVSPELHRLATKYHLHKWKNYCRHKKVLECLCYTLQAHKGWLMKLC